MLNVTKNNRLYTIKQLSESDFVKVYKSTYRNIKKVKETFGKMK